MLRVMENAVASQTEVLVRSLWALLGRLKGDSLSGGRIHLETIQKSEMRAKSLAPR